jgi:ABC-type bacteriocin/lantibiotic exporter with double-glycine peptidase domain
MMLARTLAANPRILLIDELLDTMADEESQRILEALLNADAERSIVLVTNRDNLKAMMKNVVMLTSEYQEREAQ